MIAGEILENSPTSVACLTHQCCLLLVRQCPLDRTITYPESIERYIVNGTIRQCCNRVKFRLSN